MLHVSEHSMANRLEGHSSQTPADDSTCTLGRGCHAPECCCDHEALPSLKVALCSCRYHSPTYTSLLAIQRRGKTDPAPFKGDQHGTGLKGCAVITWGGDHGKGISVVPQILLVGHQQGSERERHWALNTHSLRWGPRHNLLRRMWQGLLSFCIFYLSNIAFSLG